MTDFAYPPAIRKIALDRPRLSYRHVTAWDAVLRRAREEGLRENLVRVAADAIAHEFAGHVLREGRIRQYETPEGFEVKVDAYALCYDQLVDMLYAAYREGQSARIGPASVVGMDSKEEDLRGALKEAADVLESALSSYGTILLSDPPQEAWKARRVEERGRAAIARAMGVMG